MPVTGKARTMPPTSLSDHLKPSSIILSVVRVRSQLPATNDHCSAWRSRWKRRVDGSVEATCSLAASVTGATATSALEHELAAWSQSIPEGRDGAARIVMRAQREDAYDRVDALEIDGREALPVRRGVVRYDRDRRWAEAGRACVGDQSRVQRLGGLQQDESGDLVGGVVLSQSAQHSALAYLELIACAGTDVERDAASLKVSRIGTRPAHIAQQTALDLGVALGVLRPDNSPGCPKGDVATLGEAQEHARPPEGLPKDADGRHHDEKPPELQPDPALE